MNGMLTVLLVESRSLGVCTIVETNFERNTHNFIIDPESRSAILNIELIGIIRFTLINLYAFTSDNP